MASLYPCEEWTITLNGLELLSAGDFTGERPFRLPEQNHNIQIAEHPRSKEISIFDRGNISHDYQIIVLRRAGSSRGSREALLLHMQALQSIGNGELTMTHAESGGIRFPQAAIQGVTPLERDAGYGDDTFWGVSYTISLGQYEVINENQSVNASSVDVLASDTTILASNVS